MDEKDYELLHALDETRNITHAADKLYMTQSALSKRITPYFDVSTTHRAKTWLLDPRAPKIEPPAAVRMLQEEGK